MHDILHYTSCIIYCITNVKVAGAIKSIVGEYRLTPVDADSTRVNYRVEVRA